MKDRTREALFSILGPIEPGTVVLDLFGGTGVMSFEALSRGAERSIVVERDRPTARRIEEFAERFGVADRVAVIVADVFHWWPGGAPEELRQAAAWLVICCPPYDVAAERPEESAALLKGLLRDAPSRSRLVFESDERFDGRHWLGSAWQRRSYRPAILWLATAGHGAEADR